MNPILSIIIPCYNQEKYLAETLQSVLEQDLQEWECIIVNDGSTDNSESVAKEWLEKDTRFSYYPKENTGVSDTRNLGISKASGEFILPLDGDDLISKTYTTEALHIFKTQPDTKVVYSNLKMFGLVNKKIVSKPYSYETLLFENILFCPAIFRRADFMSMDGYNPNMKNGLEDWDFWISFLSEDDKVVKLDGFHLFYRKVEVSRSTQIDREKNEALLSQIYKNHQELYNKYTNPIRDRIQAKYFEAEARKAYWSAEFKLGAFLLFPFRWIQKRYKYFRRK